ncbi:unnamed protein product [Ilex paraguariensis]|uniref:DNA-(apurinic or apyrimidinic site) endonuclease 2 n=1 Tax=Ilex paraguariensis TaxID=185542 RepID=A0ABC8V3R5_9AQUA
MKIVTYNVNGLRHRISQYGSLLKLLDSLNADIICFQETKLSKQELRADTVTASGYESFFSCTRTIDKGRTGYSGVATFCRVKSAFSSDEVALPLAAEEGCTGLLENSRGFGTRKDEIPTIMEGLDGFTKDELLKLDSEGRCIITDHGHFVLFNIYGPRAANDDTERIQFKLTFYKILQRRWESLLHQGRRILVVGDLNIAPAAIDRCDAGPEFENNEFRRWFRSLLMENGGPFIDVFRAKYPERREAYTCWPTNTGAEEFNFGTRIDHILSAGSCLHKKNSLEGHNFINCHVEDCDILMQFKRWKPGNTPRWKGGRSIKLEGSDHVPVYMSLTEIPSTPQHSTPPLSTRYCPQVHGCQQTLVSIIKRRQSAEKIKTCGESSSFTDKNITVRSCSQSVKRSSDDGIISSSDLRLEDGVSRTDEYPQGFSDEAFQKPVLSLGSNHAKLLEYGKTKKKAREGRLSQLSLRSFFQSANSSDGVDCSGADTSPSQGDVSNSNPYSGRIILNNDESNTPKVLDLIISGTIEDQDDLDVCHSSEKEKRNVALVEWQRIQQFMQDSIPLCRGHGEPCVARVVKKAGPNLGRRFYVCARAEGPASNAEANCGHFKWAASKSKRKE